MGTGAVAVWVIGGGTTVILTSSSPHPQHPHPSSPNLQLILTFMLTSCCQLIGSGAGSGTYQLFAFDFMIDGRTLDVKLLEANGRPALCSANDLSDTRAGSKDGPRTNRCRTVPCADWLVGLTRRMEEDKQAIVRVLHEEAQAATGGNATAGIGILSSSSPLY